MELIEELFVRFIKSEHFSIELSKEFNFESIVEKECYKALNEIKEIIQNNDLEDAECFWRIEKIICLLESMGIDCGGRHDFWLS